MCCHLFLANCVNDVLLSNTQPLAPNPELPASSTQPRTPRTENPAPSTEHTAHLSTGIKEVDRFLKGGVPRGKITEIVGSDSSGKTSLGLSVLGQSTGRGEITAYIDAFDSLDPKYAEKVGIDLRNFLWIRCAGNTNHHMDALSKALRASDILCQAGGFGVIAIDIASHLRDSKIPLNTWFRLQRAIKGTPTVFMVIASQKTTGSASALILSLERNRSFWTPEKRSQFVQKPYFQGIESETYLLRGKSHGSVTVHCRF